MDSPTRKHSHFITLILCLAFVFAWGARGLTSDSLTPAEYNSIFNIYDERLDNRSTLAGTLQNVATKDETHPPGYFLLLNVWSRLGGPDLVSLRVLSIYFGLFALVFTYRLARQVGTADQAVAASVVLAFMAYFGFYLHEVRMYSPLAMVTAITAWSYARLARMAAGDGKRRLTIFCLSSAAAIYIHAFGFVLLAAIGLYHLMFAPKNRHWIHVSIAMIGAGCLYLPWLPYAIQMLGIRTSFAEDSLTWHESAFALASIYNNGLSILVPACALLLVLYRNRLGRLQRQLAIILVLVVLVTLAVNEVAPIIVARRIRYTIILAPLWACMLAIAASMLPRWTLVRLPALIIWIIAFFTFDQSPAQYLYTNSLDQNRRQVPHFQTLLYTPSLPIRRSDFILSIHQDTVLSRKTVDYYGRLTGPWSGLIHIWYDAEGGPKLQTTDTRYSGVPSMEIWNFPIWLIHNPQVTDLLEIEVFATDFLNLFHSCGRYLETDTSVIDLYVKRYIPCALLISPYPIEILYDNGTELANVMLQRQTDELLVFFWWTNTIANRYAFSLQLFDEDGSMAWQMDDVIGGSALTASSQGIGDLSAGEYSAKLIVYDYESLESQPGTLLSGQQPFEREVEIARLQFGD